MNTVEKCVKFVIIAIGIFVQSVAAMGLLHLWKWLYEEPMPGWYPWVSYLIGGLIGFFAWYELLGAAHRMFHVKQSAAPAEGTVQFIVDKGSPKVVLPKGVKVESVFGRKVWETTESSEIPPRPMMRSKKKVKVKEMSLEEAIQQADEQELL